MSGNPPPELNREEVGWPPSVCAAAARRHRRKTVKDDNLTNAASGVAKLAFGV